MIDSHLPEGIWDETRKSRLKTALRMSRGIYVIVDPEHTSGRSILEVTAAALMGGASVIQLRHKRADKKTLLQEAVEMARICHRSNALFIVNDDPEIAAASGADGVHVGQNDRSISSCRSILDTKQIVGKSNALLAEALAAADEGADYVAVGTIFPTNTKADTRPAGLSTLRKAAASVKIPVVAIGGINQSNISAVASAGAEIACVATAVTMAHNPADAVATLADKFSSAISAYRKT